MPSISPGMHYPVTCSRPSSSNTTVLLGNKSSKVTTHHSAPEIAQLLEAANRVAETRIRTPLRVIA